MPRFLRSPSVLWRRAALARSTAALPSEQKQLERPTKAKCKLAPSLAGRSVKAARTTTTTTRIAPCKAAGHEMGSSPNRRRSQRLTDIIERRPPIECITIDSSSSDDDNDVSITATIGTPVVSPLKKSTSRSQTPQAPRSRQRSQPTQRSQTPQPQRKQPSSQTKRKSFSQSRHQSTPLVYSTAPKNRSKSPVVAPRPEYVAAREPLADKTTKTIRETDPAEERLRRRRLKLEKIIGAFKAPDGIQFVVKWQGLVQLEKIALSDLRRFFPQQVLDYFYKRIKWNSKPISQTSSPQLSSQSQDSSLAT